jgi:hypothetical protein
MSENDEVGRVQKEAVVAYFNEVFHHFPRGT